GTFDGHIVGQQVINQLLIPQMRANNDEWRVVDADSADMGVADHNLPHLIFLHRVNKLGIGQFAFGFVIFKVFEYGKENRRDNQPEYEIFCHVVQKSGSSNTSKRSTNEERVSLQYRHRKLVKRCTNSMIQRIFA